MHGSRGVPTGRAALAALIAVLVMFVGVTNAYAGGRDHGKGSGHKDWAASENDSWQSGDEDSDDWSSDEKSASGDSSSKEDQGGKDCKKEEGQGGQSGEEQPGEEGKKPEVTPPVGSGGEQGEKKEGEHKGEEGKKGGETPKKGGGPAPTQPEQGPAPVTTAPVTTAPVESAPVTTQAQETPQGGEVLGESEQAPKSENQGPSGESGKRVLAENEVAAASPAASQEGGGLASTGFDAWQVALLGALCVAGSALLLRRTRRS